MISNSSTLPSWTCCLWVSFALACWILSCFINNPFSSKTSLAWVCSCCLQWQPAYKLNIIQILTYVQRENANGFQQCEVTQSYLNLFKEQIILSETVPAFSDFSHMTELKLRNGARWLGDSYVTIKWTKFVFKTKTWYLYNILFNQIYTETKHFYSSAWGGSHW